MLNSLRERILILMLIPTLALLVLSGQRLYDSFRAQQEAERTQELVQVVTNELETLQALHLERAHTMLNLVNNRGNGIRNPSEELLAARQATDAAATQLSLEDLERKFGSFSAATAEEIQEANEALQRLADRRSAIDAGGLSSDQTNAMFDTVQNELYDVDGAVTLDLTDTETAARVQSSAAFNRIKSLALERGDMLTRASGKIVDSQLAAESVGSMVAEQNAWEQVLVRQSGIEGVESLIGVDVVNRPVILSVLETESRLPQPNVLADQNLEKAESLRELEIEFIDHTMELAEAKSTAERTQLILFGLLTLGVLLTALLLVFFLNRSVISPLLRLTDVAGDVAKTLPITIERLAIGEEAPQSPFSSKESLELLDRRDELGNLARAMESSSHQATRVALGQAQTRASVARTIEDVARREQTLVERQLSLLDQLEDSEENPDQLAQLFHLDHLATRMRRNSENLLLLSSGRLPGSIDAEPLPLVDVVRSAAAEIEEYARVDVRVNVYDELRGYATTPVAHLLAEVIENAAQFSPPSSRVHVLNEELDNAVVLKIIDEGLGMEAEDIADARRRLAEPPLLEAAESRRLGLYVVGLIAQQLGILVDLQSNVDGPGLTVLVSIPQNLFVGEGTDIVGDSLSSTDFVPETNDYGLGTRPVTGAEAVELPAEPSAPASMDQLNVSFDGPTFTPPAAPDASEGFGQPQIGASPPKVELPSAQPTVSSFSEPVLETATDTQDLPTRGGLPTRGSSGSASSSSLSMSAASAGHTVDLDPGSVSALMSGLSDFEADLDNIEATTPTLSATVDDSAPALPSRHVAGADTSGSDVPATELAPEPITNDFGALPPRHDTAPQTDAVGGLPSRQAPSANAAPTSEAGTGLFSNTTGFNSYGGSVDEPNRSGFDTPDLGQNYQDTASYGQPSEPASFEAQTMSPGQAAQDMGQSEWDATDTSWNANQTTNTDPSNDDLHYEDNNEPQAQVSSWSVSFPPQ